MLPVAIQHGLLHACTIIWDPYYQNSIHRIEMLQNCAARFVLNRPWRGVPP